MSYPLQNNPGSSRYPVEVFSWFRFKQLSFSRRATSVSLIALGVLFIATVGGPIMLLGGIAVAVTGTSKLRREQRKYYALADMTPLTDEQLQALQTGTFLPFECNQWIDSLETWPCEQRVPDHWDKFKALKVVSTKNLIGQLDQSWGIISRDDYFDTFQELIDGLHTARFVATYYSQEEPEKMVQRLCGLTQLSRDDFYPLLEDKKGPRKLIWAWDLTRAIHITRLSFECGFITSEEAWANILLASAYSHTLYDNLEDFFIGVRFGHAYWSNNFEKTKERGQLLDNFLARKSPHKVLHVGWTKLNADLTPTMIGGFRALQQQVLEEQNPREPSTAENTDVIDDEPPVTH